MSQADDVPGGEDDAQEVPAWMLDPRAWRPPPGADAQPGILVRYLCGLLDSHQARALERSLARNAAARNRLIAARALLDAMEAAPMALAQHTAAQEGFDGAVAAEWLAIARAAMADGLSARRSWLEAGWHEIKRKSSAGAAAARAEWAVFLAAGEQWRLALRVAGMQPAVSRGPSTTPAAGDQLHITAAEIDAACTLHVHAAGRSGSDPVRDGVEAVLWLTSEVSAWPISTATCRDGRFHWQAAGFGEALGIPPGVLPHSSFRAVLSGAEPPPQPDVRALLAEVLGPEGQPTPEAPAVCELVGPPRSVAGEIVLTIRLPVVTRLAFRQYVLELSMPVTPGNPQALGSWLVRDWDEGPREVRVPYAAAVEATTMDDLILRARLKRVSS